MIITQMYLVLGTKKKATLKCAVLSHNTMPQMSQVLKEHVIGMLTAGMSTRAVNVHLSTISHLQCRFRVQLGFGPTNLVQPVSQPRTTCMGSYGRAICWCQRCEHGGGGVMVWACISYGPRTQLHFIDGNLNAQKYSDTIPRPIVRPIYF
jgi:hypothetical protein